MVGMLQESGEHSCKGFRSLAPELEKASGLLRIIIVTGMLAQTQELAVDGFQRD